MTDAGGRGTASAKTLKGESTWSALEESREICGAAFAARPTFLTLVLFGVEKKAGLGVSGDLHELPTGGTLGRHMRVSTCAGLSLTGVMSMSRSGGSLQWPGISVCGLP